MSLATIFRHPSEARILGKLDGKALDQLFRQARTHNGWRPIAVPDSLLDGGSVRLEPLPYYFIVFRTALGTSRTPSPAAPNTEILIWRAETAAVKRATSKPEFEDRRLEIPS